MGKWVVMSVEASEASLRARKQLDVASDLSVFLIRDNKAERAKAYSLAFGLHNAAIAGYLNVIGRSIGMWTRDDRGRRARRTDRMGAAYAKEAG